MSSRLVTLLKTIDALYKSDVLGLTVSLKFINFSFHIFIVFVPEMSTSFMSYIVWIIYITLVWILQPLLLAGFLCSKNGEHSSLHHGSRYCNLYRHGNSLAEVFIFPVMFFSKPYLCPCYHLSSPKLQNCL